VGFRVLVWAADTNQVLFASSNFKIFFSELIYLIFLFILSDIYIDTLNFECEFIAFKCDSWNKFQNGNCISCGNTSSSANECFKLGYFANKNESNNTAYVATLDKSPFCGIQYFFILTIASNSFKTKGQILLAFGSELIILSEYKFIIKI